jgi:hypothetical protein
MEKGGLNELATGKTCPLRCATSFAPLVARISLLEAGAVLLPAGAVALLVAGVALPEAGAALVVAVVAV